jgi:hypothetical protein
MGIKCTPPLRGERVFSASAPSGLCAGRAAGPGWLAILSILFLHILILAGPFYFVQWPNLLQ